VHVWQVLIAALGAAYLTEVIVQALGLCTERSQACR